MLTSQTSWLHFITTIIRIVESKSRPGVHDPGLYGAGLSPTTGLCASYANEVKGFVVREQLTLMHQQADYQGDEVKMQVPKLNPCGLTWDEWAAAAGSHMPMWICIPKTLREAWIRGEDPTEYLEPNASTKG